MTIICPWCGAVIVGRHKECPDCGVLLARLSMPIVAPAPPEARSSKMLWLLAITPLMFSVLLPAGILSLHEWTQAPVAQANLPDADSALAQGWTAGIAGLRAQFGVPRFVSLGRSSVYVSAGHLITLCGRAKLKAPADGAVIATRYLSMQGDAGGTKLAFEEPSFDILWTRLCRGDGGGW